MKIIKVKLFGAFKNYINEPEVEIVLEKENQTVREIKRILSNKLQQLNSTFDVALIVDSVLADESKIFENDEVIDGESYAILPPVCGG